MTTPTSPCDDDIFHAVTMTEESSWNEGYHEGVEMGRKKAFEEGYSLGATKGTEIGKEIGFYSGYAAQILHICKEENSKASADLVNKEAQRHQDDKHSREVAQNSAVHKKS
ncbi:oral cancer-overexpressed protein 1 [Elysia marginata]|uniref:Oral cancer-overexpressed protein 1 n=1 Tax=Elysia marginata TaxID=1093978 RepID=A0AAV4EL29_9GAST|nr:oral cancer-overexpressed protein 1 [Elysia marginata]